MDIQTFQAEVVLKVTVEAFNLLDAEEEIYNEFGKGIYGAVEVLNTTVEDIQ